MEKDYFLTYANYSLQDNPKHLKTLVSNIVYQEQDGDAYEDIEPYGLIGDAILSFIEDKEMELNEESPGFRSFNIEKFVSLAKKIPYLDRERLIKESTTVFREWLSEDNPLLAYFIGIYDIVYQTVNGCGDEINGCCYNTKKSRWGLFGRSGMLEGPKRLRCHECDQLYFTFILLEIIRGKEYWHIQDFEYILDLCNQTIITRREIHLKEIGKDRLNWPHHTLATRELVEYPLRFEKKINEINTYYDFNPFRLALFCSAFKSLVDFLLDNDRKKLKYCDECEKFFISKTIRTSRFCSDKCRLSWHNRKRIESGEHREYKRRKRMEGAKESYYG